MIKKSLRRRATAFAAAIAAAMLLASVTSSAASADTVRTLDLTLTCSTGEAYGLLLNTGSGWYTPSGSSTVINGVKVFTVSIPASATSLEFQPLSCDNQGANAGGFYSGPYWEGDVYSLTPGTSTISADGICNDYIFNDGGTFLFYTCYLNSLTYG